MNSAEVIVVGLGAVGAATLYQLARAGVSAIGIDRWSPPHAQGSSHGETRITRVGVGEGEAYVPLALRSHEIWRDLEAQTGETLLVQCGFVAIDGSGGRSIMHGKAEFADRTVAAARAFGIVHERLTPAELMHRHPAFRLCGDEAVYFEPGGGFVYPERCIAAQLAAARRLGARLVTGERVLSVHHAGAGVEILTAHARYGGARAVIAAGGWTPGLVPGGLAGLRLLRQVLHWFAPSDPALFQPGRCPTFIWTHGPRAEDSFYGFPNAPGATPGVKLATEQFSVALPDADGLDRAVQPAEVAAILSVHADGRLTPLARTALRSAACLYTNADDGDFVIGSAPGAERVLIASACSGHGFKHSAGLGEQLARIVTCGAVLDPAFALDRPSLALPHAVAA